MRTACGQLSASGALVVVLVGYLMVRQPMLAEDVKASQQVSAVQQQQITELQQQTTANRTALNKANSALVALGKPPVPVPPTPAPVHQDEFTEQEAAAVRLIVADQIAKAKAPLTQAEITQIAKAAAALIPKPADGKSPTPAQMQTYVKVAVASYCLEGRCQGKPGESIRGDKGDPAPKVTDEELLRAAQTALAAYCAQEEKPCKGEPGAPGGNGQNGKDAPPPFVPVDMDCVGDDKDSVWRTYFSNGTEQKVITTAGPCRVGKDPGN